MAKARDDLLKAFLAEQLVRAVQENNTAPIDLCLEKGGDINAVSGTQSALWLAVNAEKESIVRHILTKKPNVDLGDVSDGETPLMRAITRENMTIAKMLLDAGADAFAADNRGNTAASTLKNKQWNDHRKQSQVQQMILSALPAAAQEGPIDPRVKEDTESAPMPDLKKKPFPGSNTPATGGP